MDCGPALIALGQTSSFPLILRWSVNNRRNVLVSLYTSGVLSHLSLLNAVVHSQSLVFRAGLFPWRRPVAQQEQLLLFIF